MKPYFLREFDENKLKPAVCVLIERDDRILMIKRAKEDVGAGYWTPVTGSVNLDEKIIDAVHREVDEEVNLKIEPVKELWQTPTTNFEYLLHWWWTRWVACEVIPEPAEVEDFLWLEVDEIMKLKPMYADTYYFFDNIWNNRNS